MTSYMISVILGVLDSIKFLICTITNIPAGDKLPPVTGPDDMSDNKDLYK